MVNDFDTSAECRLAEMRSHRNDVDEQMNMVSTIGGPINRHPYFGLFLGKCLLI